MTITLALAWWHVPALITLLAFGLIFHIARKDFGEGGLFAGVATMLSCVPTFAVVAIAWAAAGFLK